MNSRPSETALARAAWIRALERTAPIERQAQRTLPVVIESLAERCGPAPALQSSSATLTYRELAALARRCARWALQLGLGPGDVVGLLSPNCVEYLAVWLGITRTGASVALLNTHLGGDALAHSIHAVTPKHVIAAAECTDTLRAALQRCGGRAPVAWTLDRADAATRGFEPLLAALATCSAEPLGAAECALPSLDDAALYIYTSGTTGWPKAARVSHHRLMQWSHWFAGMMDTGPEDRMYNCLPMYHSVGGVVATGATLVGGGTVVIRTRFSASEFWDDVRDTGCTLFQYIGELCRYLVNASPHAPAVEHRLRLACGNGLRPEVWEAFRTRFGIPRILEYYASTEGNFSLYNAEGEPGAIGRIPPFLAHRLPVALVRCDVDSGEPQRGVDGRCQPCGADEVGAAIGRIPGAGDARTGRFEGYLDAQATERKVVRDVFEAGDAWYHTGDLMRRDARGYYYFVDRVGDTYRWKGENVSTTEVLAALCGCTGVLEGVVFGVAVPGADGRAGMAAVVVGPGFDLATLHRELRARLPDYARPVFVRILPALAATGTFKPVKRELLREGFDPAAVTDALFVDDRRAQAYVALDAALHSAIVSGTLRL